MKKTQKRKWKRILGITGLAAVLLLGGIYLGGVVYYQSHFLPGTKINDIDMGNKKVEELASAYDGYELTVLEKGEEGRMLEKKISGKDAGLFVSDKEIFEKMLQEQSVWNWFVRDSGKREEEKGLEVQQDKIVAFVEGLEGIKNPDVQPPVNASLSEYAPGEGYSIIPEVIGGRLKRDKTISVITEAMENLREKVDLAEADCYEKPKITSDNKKLNKLVETLNKWLETEITYDFGENQEIVDEDVVQSWITIKKKKAELQKEKVEEFVASMRRQYDTIFRSRSFKTTSGKTITIEGGDYGWWMNTGAEIEKLISLVEKGKKTSRTPEYYQKAAVYGKKDYGESYVEINLTAQHLYLYIEGKKVLESDFVSGNTSRGNGTPEGVYSLTYKEEMAQLIGETYSTPVSYWMPFNQNIGMHDATWRSQFGSSLYKSGGSHGCINLPYGIAKKIYSYVEKGFPVICYNLPGTESDSITRQSDEEIAKSVVESINKIGKVTTESKKRIEHSRRIYNELNSTQRSYVKNYQKLVDAEQKLSSLGR